MTVVRALPPVVPGDTEPHTLEKVEAAAAVIRERFESAAEVGIVLGTGVGALAAEMEIAASIDCSEIPGFPQSSVESHAGRLVCGTLSGRKVVALQGRVHRYEGFSLQQVTFPVRVLRALGSDIVIVTNSCGALNPEWQAGDLMLISDHINLMGDSPLVGMNDERLGPRFPDMSRAYDAALRRVTAGVALDQRVVLREGVYAALTGPSTSTPAEQNFLRAVGADAVGMSTVPEVIVAVHGGMRVLGLAVVTKVYEPGAQIEPDTQGGTVPTAREAEPRLTALVRGVLGRLP